MANIPIIDFRGKKFTDENGILTDAAQYFFDSLTTALIKNIGQEGLVAPTQTDSNITLIQNNISNNAYTCQYGTIIYDSSTNIGKIALNDGTGKPKFYNIESSGIIIFPITPSQGGTGVANADSSTITLGGAIAFVGAYTFTGNLTGNTNVTFPTSGTLATVGSTISNILGTANQIDVSVVSTVATISIDAAYTGQTSITTLGTIATGTWNGTIISPTYGGTGINNGSNTLTLAGSLATVGAFGVTFNFTNTTNVTFPTSGTLATVGGQEASNFTSYTYFGGL